MAEHSLQAKRSVAVGAPVGVGRGGISLRVERLSKRFHKGGQVIEVLRDVDLELAAGEHVAIIGPSGSGKSTFLHVVGTLDRPDEGTVRFNGADAFAGGTREVDARRNKSIGFVFQFHHLLSDQTALWNTAMPAVIAGIERAEAQALAERALARMELGGRLHHRPGELSGGEQQRVAIARAMVMRPGLLLADEPTGNLDPRTAQAVFDQLLALHDEVGSTLVVVTHSRELAGRFPRRLRLVEGRFVEEG
ncbi:MAG: ABC transporter ATP-binding protein [Pseudomonadota bacterium]